MAGTAPISNVDYEGRFFLSPEGARAARTIPAHEDIGLFVYYEWNAVAVRTRDLSLWVTHSSAAPTCELVVDTDHDDYRWTLVAAHTLRAGDLLTLDYRRAEWFIFAPRVPLVGVPLAPPTWRVSSSPVHGRGVFAVVRLDAEYVLGEMIRFDYLVVPVFTRELCRHVNHSWTPNARLMWSAARRAGLLVTTRRVGKGTEVTLDYRSTPWYAGKPDPAWK